MILLQFLDAKVEIQKAGELAILVLKDRESGIEVRTTFTTAGQKEVGNILLDMSKSIVPASAGDMPSQDGSGDKT